MATIAKNPTDSGRMVSSVARSGKNVFRALQDLGYTFYHADPSYLGSCVIRVVDAAGVVVDVPLYGIAAVASWIPVVNWVPLGGTWATIRRHD